MVDPLTSLNPINHLKMLYLKKERHFASLFFSLRFSFSLLPSSLTRVFEMSTAWMVEIEKVIHNVFARFDWLLVSSTKVQINNRCRKNLKIQILMATFEKRHLTKTAGTFLDGFYINLI